MITRSGIRIIPDRIIESWPAEHLLSEVGNHQPSKALDEALRGIAIRYGMPTADFVAMQLEYPRNAPR